MTFLPCRPLRQQSKMSYFPQTYLGDLQGPRCTKFNVLWNHEAGLEVAAWKLRNARPLPDHRVRCGLLIRELSTQHPLPVCWFLSDKDQRKQNKAPTQIHLGVINSALSETTESVYSMFHYTAIVFFSLAFLCYSYIHSWLLASPIRCNVFPFEISPRKDHDGLTEKKNLLAPDLSSWLLLHSILWGMWRYKLSSKLMAPSRLAFRTSLNWDRTSCSIVWISDPEQTVNENALSGLWWWLFLSLLYRTWVLNDFKVDCQS